MKALSGWQLVVVAVVAVACLGAMALQVYGLQSRRSEGSARARKGTMAESMRYGAQAPSGARVFDGFSYRVGARFAGRARVVVDGDSVVICGPRGPRGLYWFWIWLQALTLAAVPALLVWAALALDWKVLAAAVGVAVFCVLVMAIGAGVWPGLGEVEGLEDGLFPALEHDVAFARDVKIGSGWADGGLRWVLLPYVSGIDAIATDHAVSWWGPDESGNEVRYAFHCYDAQQAQELSALLGR